MANYDQQLYYQLNDLDDVLKDIGVEQVFEGGVMQIEPREIEAASGETVREKSNSNGLIPLGNIDNIWNKFDLFKTNVFVEQQYEVMDPNLLTRKSSYDRRNSSINDQSTSQDEQKEIQGDELSLTADEEAPGHDHQSAFSSEEATAVTENKENSINESNQAESTTEKPRTVLNKLRTKIIQKHEIKPNADVSRREKAAETDFVCDDCDKGFLHKTSLTRHKKHTCPNGPSGKKK